MDGEGEYTCETWGELGEPGIPVLIDTDQFFLWFILDGYPDFVILDHNMVVAYKFAELDFDSVNTQIQIALDNCQQCETTDISHNQEVMPDRKSTRLNSSHKPISYAVFCLKKKIST